MVSYEDTPIAQLSPITKIVAVFSLGLSTLIFPNSWLGVVLVIFLFGVAYAARMLQSFAKIMFGFGIPISIMLLFIQGLFSPRNETVLADLGFAELGLEGVLYAAKIVVTLLVFLGSFYLMNKTTYTGRLVAALTNIGLSPKVGYLVLASLNVVPQMQRRMSVIQEAQGARGLNLEGGLMTRMKAYVPLLGPVVMSSLTDAQERGMTLETRGFGVKGTHTTYVEAPYTRRDRILTWFFCGFFIVIVTWSILDRWQLLSFGGAV